MGFFRQLFGRLSGRRRAGAGDAETGAEKAARKYWEREVADEKVRRGTADPRRKE